MIKVRDLLKRLGEDGWIVVRQRGSHRQLQHPSKPHTIAVAGHPADTLAAGTYKSILRRAELEDIR